MSLRVPSANRPVGRGREMGAVQEPNLRVRGINRYNVKILRRGPRRSGEAVPDLG
jgi:hypothetical protein